MWRKKSENPIKAGVLARYATFSSWPHISYGSSVMTPSGQEPAAYETTGDMAVAARPRANSYPRTFVHSRPVSRAVTSIPTSRIYLGTSTGFVRRFRFPGTHHPTQAVVLDQATFASVASVA